MTAPVSRTTPVSRVLVGEANVRYTKDQLDTRVKAEMVQDIPTAIKFINTEIHCIYTKQSYQLFYASRFLKQNRFEFAEQLISEMRSPASVVFQGLLMQAKRKFQSQNISVTEKPRSSIEERVPEKKL